MQDQQHYDKLIAKIQYFADKLDQIKTENESLAIILQDPPHNPELELKISVYEEILHDYYESFKDILYR